MHSKKKRVGGEDLQKRIDDEYNERIKFFEENYKLQTIIHNHYAVKFLIDEINNNLDKFLNELYPKKNISKKNPDITLRSGRKIYEDNGQNKTFYMVMLDIWIQCLRIYMLRYMLLKTERTYVGGGLFTSKLTKYKQQYNKDLKIDDKPYDILYHDTYSFANELNKLQEDYLFIEKPIDRKYTYLINLRTVNDINHIYYIIKQHINEITEKQFLIKPNNIDDLAKLKFDCFKLYFAFLRFKTILATKIALKKINTEGIQGDSNKLITFVTQYVKKFLTKVSSKQNIVLPQQRPNNINPNPLSSNQELSKHLTELIEIYENQKAYTDNFTPFNI